MRFVIPSLGLALSLGVLSPAVHSKDRSDTKAGPPKDNLEVSSSLSEKSRKLVESAISLYGKAFHAKGKREKLFKKVVRKLVSATRDKEAKTTALPHFYLGSAYNQLRNFPDAQTSLEKAVELNDRFHQAHVLLAEVLSKQSASAGALESFDRALAIHPKYDRALIGTDILKRGVRGKAAELVKLGKYKKASKVARNAISGMKRRDKRVRYLMGLIFQLKLGNKGPDWDEIYVAETDNYKVLAELSQEFAEEIAQKVELIRRAYLVVFPNIKRPERKYEIWAYRSKTAYHKSGAPPQAAGHYSPLFRRLVIFRHAKEKDTTLVLYHEAFHQFLHEYMELAPQWFNEGLGDYFGPFEYVRRGKKETMRSRPNPWRLKTVQYGIRNKMLPTPTELMLMSREEMYDPRMGGFHYAQAWSLIYFMIENGTYSKTLVKYFKELLKGRGIDAAYANSFGKINMKKFEKAWIAFMLNRAGR